MFETHGYPLESHKVETEDGYILTLLRVPRGRGQDVKESEPDKPEEKRPAVLLVHGVVASGDFWFLNTPEKALPFILVDQGYDCWVANIRGTPLSKGHISLKSDSKEFWDFSFHEQGAFDHPAIINYILETTGNQKLFCVGHSMGCASLLIALSLKPEFCTKVEMIIALAPAYYLKNIRNILSRYVVLPLGYLLGPWKTLYKNEVSADSISDIAKKLCPRFCNLEKMTTRLLKIFGIVCGNFGKDQVEPKHLMAVASVYPTSTSLKVVAHGSQCYVANRMQQFDFGNSENMKRYGQRSPPVYELKNVTVPVVTFYSEDDRLCTPKDVTRLAEELPNVIGNYEISHPNFGHNDFLAGKDAAELVFSKILDILKTFREIKK